jgi:hypothetical protein
LAAHAVVSGAIFKGVDTTDSSAKPIDIFKDAVNYATAAASILTFSASSVDFHPAEQEPKGLAPTLDEFVKKASSFPGFLSTSSSDVAVTFNGSFTQFEQVIRDQLDDALAARAFRDLIPGYIEDNSLTDWTLSLVVLSKPEASDVVTVGFSRVSLSILTDKTHTTYIPKQSTRLMRANYKLRDSFLTVNADNLANMMSIVKTRDFTDYFTSPKVFVSTGEDLIEHSSISCPKYQQSTPSWLD